MASGIISRDGIPTNWLKLCRYFLLVRTRSMVDILFVCLSDNGVKILMEWRTNTFVLYIEASRGGRRSSQLPLEHYIAHESVTIIVILTIFVLYYSGEMQCFLIFIFLTHHVLAGALLEVCGHRKSFF
jgi:hypothetical protein